MERISSSLTMQGQIQQLITAWEMYVPDFPLCYQDLNKPVSKFFVQAVLKLLDMLDIDVNGIMRETPPAMKIADQFRFPLFQLTETINFLLKEISIEQITISAFIQPTSITTVAVLKLLLNHYLHITGLKQQIVVKENKIKDDAKEIANLNSENDKLKNDLDKYLQEIQKSKDHMEMMEKEIFRLKIQNKEPETIVNDLKSENDIIQEKKETLSLELSNKKTIWNSYMEKINSVEECIITENEQIEIIKSKECESQRLKEIQDKNNEAKNNVWKKEEDIKIFKSRTTLSYKIEMELNELESLYNKVKTMENSTKTSYESEKQHREMQDEISTLNNKLSEIKMNNLNLEEKVTKLKSQISEEDKQYTIDENANHDYVEKTSSLFKETRNFKEPTNEMYEESLQLIKSIDNISAFYDKQIEEYLNKVDETMSRMKDVETKYLNFLK